MNLNPESPSHGILQWSDELPKPFKGFRLPGGEITSSQGSFGSLCIQHFETDLYSIRFHVFDIIQRCILKFKNVQPGLYANVQLKGKKEIELETGKSFSLRQNQFNILFSSETSSTITHEKNLHISFETFFSAKLADELLSLFPAIKEKINNNGLINSPRWADAETLELVHSILRCKYEKELRRHFFESRVRDLLFKFLVLSSQEKEADNDVSEKDLEAIYEAERIISINLSDHIHITALSRKVLLNEFRLKKLFKRIFGMGPYEYLVNQRMKKAKQMLEDGLSVKEVAAKTGYRPTDFIVAFRQFYGFTPGSVKKRDS